MLKRAEQFICSNHCFEYDISYEEGAMRENSSFLDVQSAESCYKKCLSVKGCDYWSWVPGKPTVCSLKEKYVRGIQLENAISGPKMCTNMMKSNRVKMQFERFCDHPHGSRPEDHPDPGMWRVCKKDSPLWSTGQTYVQKRLKSEPRKKYEFICKRDFVEVCLDRYKHYLSIFSASLEGCKGLLSS